MNIEKSSILYVDDEEISLKYFKNFFNEKFPIITASNANDGYKIIQENPDKIAVLLTDQKMPGTKGVELLEKTRKLNPAITRILVTAYSEIQAAIEAVNKGNIFRYISKPWDIVELEKMLNEALNEHVLQNNVKACSLEDVGSLSYPETRDIILGSLKKTFFESALKKHDYIISRAAKEIGVSRRIIQFYLQDIGYYKNHEVRYGRIPLYGLPKTSQ